VGAHVVVTLGSVPEQEGQFWIQLAERGQLAEVRLTEEAVFPGLEDDRRDLAGEGRGRRRAVAQRTQGSSFQ
jgi:hypothetical protein